MTYWAGVARHPQAYRLVGNYELTAEEVEVFVQHFDWKNRELVTRRVGEFNLWGDRGDGALAKRIVEEGRKRLGGRTRRCEGDGP